MQPHVLFYFKFLIFLKKILFRLSPNETTRGAEPRPGAETQLIGCIHMPKQINIWQGNQLRFLFVLKQK